jgi:tRNA-dihydrouridine synthase
MPSYTIHEADESAHETTHLAPIAIHKRTAEEIKADQAEWEAIVAARERAARRNTISVNDHDIEEREVVRRADSGESQAVSGYSVGGSGSEGSVTPSRE